MAPTDTATPPKVHQIVLATPRGFCAGVERAIEIVERALTLFGAPIYVRHEVVHNKFVVDGLRRKGAVFIELLDEVPPGSTVIFSAHGVSQAVRNEAKARNLQVFDATCPLVTKVHLEVARLHKQEYELVMIGHRGHPEVEGTIGQVDAVVHLVECPEDVADMTVKDPEHLAYVTQTTLSMDDASQIITALRQRFPNISGPKKDDICYATQNRQDAVKQLATEVDAILVVGSPNSSNSNRLREVAALRGTPAWLIDNETAIDPAWLKDKKTVGVTAGASAPEILVNRVIERLRHLGHGDVRLANGVTEQVVFPLPKELR